MPAWSRAVLAVVALLLMVGPVLAATDTAPPDAVDEPSVSNAVGTTNTFEANTTYRIDMRADGNASWQITVAVPLENDSQRDGFEAIAERFESGEFLSTRPFVEASQQVSDATGRPMQVTDVDRRVNTTDQRGELVLSFTWTNFGYRQGEQLYVDDVFRTDDRLLSGLDDHETLIVTRPSGYQFNSASTNIQDGVLRWDGPYTFGPDEPYVSFNPIRTDTPAPDPSDEGDDDGSNALMYAFAGVLLLGTLVAVGYVARYRDGPLLPVDAGDGDDAETAAETESRAAEPATEPAGTEAGEDAGDAADETEDDDADEAGETGTEPADEERSEDSEAGAPIDEELLSDEERVERLLEANGGRMKQANIVDETGWSNAKVSQLLSAMDEAGRIEKLRIGRENLISFPEEDADDES